MKQISKLLEINKYFPKIIVNHKFSRDTLWLLSCCSWILVPMVTSSNPGIIESRLQVQIQVPTVTNSNPGKIGSWSSTTMYSNSFARSTTAHYNYHDLELSLFYVDSDKFLMSNIIVNSSNYGNADSHWLSKTVQTREITVITLL